MAVAHLPVYIHVYENQPELEIKVRNVRKNGQEDILFWQKDFCFRHLTNHNTCVLVPAKDLPLKILDHTKQINMYVSGNPTILTYFSRPHTLYDDFVIKNKEMKPPPDPEVTNFL